MMKFNMIKILSSENLRFKTGEQKFLKWSIGVAKFLGVVPASKDLNSIPGLFMEAFIPDWIDHAL